MSTCVTKKQWAEVYNREKTSLYQQEVEGYDIEEAMADLEAMNNRFNEGKIQEARKIAKAHAKTFTDLTTTEIHKVNKNKPRTLKGAPLRVVGGYKDSDGNVTYKVRYPGNNTTYTLNDGLIHLDQMAAKESIIYGSEAGAVDKIDAHNAKLKEDIWNDQKAAMQLFDELAAMDPHADVEHTAELRELLGDITDPTKEILNEFKTYIDTEAAANNGIAQPVGKDPKMVLNIAPSNMTAGMSPTEMYVHEMIHMSIGVASTMKGKMAGEIAELGRVYELAAKKITVDSLIENGDRARAERMYDYMFNNEDSGLAEFVAYAMTNKALKSELKKIGAKKEKMTVATDSVWDKLVWLVVRVYEGIRDLVTTKSHNDTLDERVGKLVTELWMHNNQTIENKGTYEKISRNVESKQDKVDGILRSSVVAGAILAAKALDYIAEKADGTILGTAAKATRFAGNIFNPYESDKSRAVTAQTFREFEKAFENWGIGGVFAQEGSLMTMMNYMKSDDSETTRVETLGLVAQNIDRFREIVIERVGKPLLESLGNPSHHTQESLTKALIETDAKVLMDDYTLDEISEMLSNDAKLQEVIDNELDELDKLEADQSNRNYYRSQVKGLGMYMATGKSGSSLNMNAEEIADMRYTKYWRGRTYKNRDGITSRIDKLATLEAMRNANASAKEATVLAIKERPGGVEDVLNTHKLHETEDLMYRAGHGKINRQVKGEIKDLKKPYVESRMSADTVAERAKMKKDGFSYVGPSHVDGVALYKKYTNGMDSFDKQAVAKINEAKEMHSITKMTNLKDKFDEDFGSKAFKKVNNLTKAAEDDVDAQRSTGSMPDLDGYIAIRDSKMKIADYGVSMDREMYADAVIQDKKAPVLLGKMIGEIKEKHLGGIHNSEVMNEINKDMLKNYKKRGEVGSKNKREYIEIGPDAETGTGIAKNFSDQLFKDMPQNMKEDILSRPKGQRFIAVRRDMAVMYFGKRAPSLLNAKVPFTGKSVDHLLRANDLAHISESIRLAGDIWQEVISIIKVDIVIKTPIVVYNNIISNFNYSWMLGQAPWKTAAGQTKMFIATKNYLDREKELVGLEFEISKGNDVVGNRKKIKQLKNIMKESPVYPLMKAGLFTAVLEDLRLKDLKTETRAGAALDKMTQKIPTLLRDAASTLYITQDSQLFGAMMMTTAYSDFVARANRYYFLVEEKGYSSNVAMKMVTDEFVNYNRKLGDVWEWLKSMGFSQFHQYFFGSNKNMAAKLKHKPTAMIMMNGFMDWPTPGDAFILNKDMSTNLYGPMDILTDQVPLHIPNPSLLEALGLWRS